MLVFWLAVCFEQVAIQISICCLSKRFFILEYCELTAMESNITSVSKREKVISLVVGLKQLFFLRILPVESASQLWLMTIIRWCEKTVSVRVSIPRRSVSCAQFLVVVAVSFENFSEEMVSHFPWLSGALACKSQNHKEMRFGKFLASAAVHVNRCLGKSPTVHPCARSWFGRLGYLWEQEPLSSLALVIPWNR